MYVLGSAVEEGTYVVAQLGASHDAVVAEDDALVFQDGGVGHQLHLGHEFAACLTAGGEGARPSGGVFHDGTLVGNVVAF